MGSTFVFYSSILFEKRQMKDCKRYVLALFSMHLVLVYFVITIFFYLKDIKLNRFKEPKRFTLDLFFD
ncbi:unnamed protein product [Brassica oleracea var. botrytis]